MANRITGSTDISGALSILPSEARTVCLVAARGSDIGTIENLVFDVTGTTDAAAKWGPNAPAVDIVKDLLNKGVSKIKGIIVRGTNCQTNQIAVAGTVTTAGNATVTVTASGLTGSPVAVVVALALGDTATQVAAKIAAALKLNANIAAFAFVATYGNIVQLSKKTGAVNDATFNIALANTTCAGLTAIVTSTNTAPIAAKQDCYDDALDRLLMLDDQMVIIVDETDSTVHAVVKTHLDLAEAEDKFRLAVVGAPVGQTNAQVVTLAQAINSKRMFMACPNVADSSGNELSGYRTAAGLAALISTETSDPAMPMNGLDLVGYGGVSRVLLKAERDTLVAGGVIPLVTGLTGPSVFRMVTTYTKNAQSVADTTWQEGTTIMIADDVLSSVQARLKAKYPRTKNIARVLKSIRTDIIDVLQAKDSLEIIENFDPNTVSVLKDPNDTYGALVDYTFDVVTPLYTISIRQHMKV